MAQSPPLPPLVESSIDDDTIAIARIDLSHPQTLEASKLISNSVDPIAQIGTQYSNFHRAIETLVANDVKDLYVIVSTNDLLRLGATLVIPLGGAQEKKKKIATDLQTIWLDQVQEAPNGLIVSNKKALFSKETRPEFSAAFSTVKDDPVQIVMCFGHSARRVLRDSLPSLLKDLDSASTTALADGWEWTAIGVQFGPKRHLKTIIQAKDEVAASNLKQTIDRSIKSLSGLAEQQFGSRRINELLAAAKLNKESARLSLVLSNDDGSVKAFLDEIAVPIAAANVKGALQKRTVQNLKSLVLALHQYHDQHTTFPPAAILSKDGNKLLSWRVAILPWVGEEALYKQFRLDEPWDSPHNKSLIAQMPQVFASPNVSPEQRTEGQTTYLGLIAKKSLFGSNEGIPIRLIRDGTSNTIAIVDANGDRAVLWTKPEDLIVDLDHPHEGLVGQNGGGFWAGFCDGSARRIPDTIKVSTLRNLIQIDDGQSIEAF